MGKVKGYIPSYEECKLAMEIIMRVQEITKSKYVNGLEVQNYISTCCYYWTNYYKQMKNKEK